MKKKGILTENTLNQIKELAEWTDKSSKSIEIDVNEQVQLERIANELERIYRSYREEWKKMKKVI